MTGSPHALPAPQCPRCGYNQQGAIDAWSDTCPIEGVCSECGLRFRWRDVLCPRWRNLPWLYEHARRRLNIRAAWRTCFATLLPWRFWSNVRPHHRLCVSRLLLWPIVLLGSAYIASVIIAEAIAMTAVLDPRSSANGWWLVQPLTSQLNHFWDGSKWMMLNGEPVTTGSLMLLLFAVFFSLGAGVIVLVVPSAWKRQKVRPAHLLRIAVYGTGSAMMIYLITLPHWLWNQVGELGAHLGLTYGPSSMTGGPISTIFHMQTYWWPPDVLWHLMSPFFAMAILFTPPAWLSLWWWYALRRGLELRGVFFVWLFAVIAGALCGLVGFVLLDALL